MGSGYYPASSCYVSAVFIGEWDSWWQNCSHWTLMSELRCTRVKLCVGSGRDHLLLSAFCVPRLWRMLTQPAGCRFPLHFIISAPTHHPSKKSGKIFALWCKRLFSFSVTGCLCSEVILTTIAVIAEYWHSVWFQVNTQKAKLCICFLPWAGRSTADILSVSACFRVKALARCLQAKGLPCQWGNT